ncbi:hypothetical protein AMTRI_Chr02g215120 [Amborella trichopoda]
MELPDIVGIARSLAVMVRIQGPDPKGRKMRRHAFHHSESGKTALSASGFLLSDSFGEFAICNNLQGLDHHGSSASTLVVTSASIVEPFLSAQHQSTKSKGTPQLIYGAEIDVLVEIKRKPGDNGREEDHENPCWMQSHLVALVDVPASFLALQTLLEAHSGSSEQGSWDVGWSLAPLQNDPLPIEDASRTQDGSGVKYSFEIQKRKTLDVPSNSRSMAMLTSRLALLRLPGIVSKDLPLIKIASPSKRGDLLLVVGSPFGVLSPMHFFNSVSVGAVANCCPPASCNPSLLMADIRCLPGMEGSPVFNACACLVGILTRPLRQRAGGAEVQLVVTWDAIATALREQQPNSMTIPKNEMFEKSEYGMEDACLMGDHPRGTILCVEPLSSGLDSHSLVGFEKAMASVVLVTVGDGAWASGIILNQHGLILTNAHLLEPWRFGKTPQLNGTDEDKLRTLTRPFKRSFQRQESGESKESGHERSMGNILSSVGFPFYKSYRRIRVRLDHREPRMWCDAKPIYISKGPLDIALLQLEHRPNVLQPIIPDTQSPSPGSRAYVVGHGLFGPRSDLCPSVSSGVVARVVKTQIPVKPDESNDSEERNLPAMLETTAAVHAGGSGGAVVNTDGCMIGLVTSNARHSGGTVIPHLNFSIPYAALIPVFKFAKDMQDMSVLQVLDKPNEPVSTVWALMPQMSPRPLPRFPYLPESLLDQKEGGKGSRFAKFITEHVEKGSFGSSSTAEFIPSKL